MSDEPRYLRRAIGGADSPADSSASSPAWITLPDDVTSNILNRLGAVDILKSAQKVCTTWRRVCKDPSMWRVIDLRSQDYFKYEADELEAIGRQAVDRSRGQLIDFTFQYFGSDGLLLYIGQRSNHLKRLKIVNCYDFVSAASLRAAVENFPELEELHLFYMFSLQPMDMENIGTSCPLLKVFSFNDRGLKAILNNCPHLESLDIRQCFNVDLSGDIATRCCEQIKLVRGPDASMEDYERGAEIRGMILKHMGNLMIRKS